MSAAPESCIDLSAAPCPVCGGAQARFAYPIADLPFGEDARSWDYARCDGCGHGLIAPRPSDRELKEFYEQLYSPEKLEVMRKANESGFDRKLRQHRLRAILKALGDAPVRRVLDVGCGLGHFLRELGDGLDGDPELVGVELGEAAAQVAEARLADRPSPQPGDRVIRQLFDQIELAPGSVDLLSMNHFLEHHPQPEQALRRAAELVRSGGLIEVELPRSGGWAQRLFGRWWWPHLPPQHIHLFQTAGLRRALADAGFSAVLQERLAAYPLNVSAALVFWMRHKLGSRSAHAGKPLAKALAYLLGLPLLLPAMLIDLLIAPVLNLRGGDIYMVVARRD